MQIRSFKDLTVWQKSMDLVADIYSITSNLPKQEVFGLISQIQRAAVSIPSNIAEGSKRSSRIDFRQFCMVAAGSAAELETQLMIVKRIYPSISVESALQKIVEIQKMLNGLTKKLQTKSNLKTTN